MIAMCNILARGGAWYNRHGYRKIPFARRYYNANFDYNDLSNQFMI